MARFLTLASLLLVVATPVLAQPANTDAGGAATPAPAPAKPKKVCRSFKVTGQRIAKTTCYTAEQWADLDRTNQESANKFVTDVSRNGSRANIQDANTSSIFGLGPTQ